METVINNIEQTINILEEKINLIEKSIEIYNKQDLHTTRHYSDKIAKDMLTKKEEGYEDFFNKINLMNKKMLIKCSDNIFKMILKEIFENDFLSKKNEKTFYELMQKDVTKLNAEEKITYAIVTEFYEKNAEIDIKYYKKLIRVLKHMKSISLKHVNDNNANIENE